MAVKVIDRKLMLLTSYLENMKKEIKIIKALKHPSIIKFFNVFQTEHHIYLITEYC